MTMEQMIPQSLKALSGNSESSNNLSKADEKKIVDFVRKGFDLSKSDRWKAEKQWFLNLAFYFGQQNIMVSDAPGTGRQFRLYTPPAPYYRARPVINRIRPLIRTEMSKLTAQKPNAYIVPASSDDRDLFAANAGEQIWDSIQREHKVNSVMRRAVFWATLTGNGFIKDYWDDYKLDRYSDLQGTMCFEAITPFHIFVPDLKEDNIEDQPWVIHGANRSVEQLELQYGISMKISKSSKGDTLEENFTTAMGISNQDTKKQNTTLVMEAWIKPGAFKMFPEGAMVTVAQDKVIAYEHGWPYVHNQYPFSHVSHIETGKFYRDSVITDLISPQREFNRTRGQIIEAKNKMAKPQLLAEMGAVDPGKITSEPGQVILYRPGFNPPQPLPLVSLPSYVLQELDRIQLDMNEISGQHEVSRGGAPAGVTAATAISYLQEQDDTKLAYTYASIEEAMEKIAYHTLCHVKQYWDTPRMIRTTGTDGSFDVMAFQGSDLRDNTDIRIEGGSSLPTSKAAKQAFILDLMKMGFIDPTKGLEVLEIGGINKIYESVQIDVRQAQRENLKLAQITDEIQMQHDQETIEQLMQDPQAQEMFATGVLQMGPDGLMAVVENPETGEMEEQPFDMPLIVPVNSWDNHRLHIERHNQFRKSQSYDNLPQAAKDAFEEHVNGHVHAIMVGAQGAMGLNPEMMGMSDNPETFQEMEATGQPIPGENPEAPPPSPEESQ